jgi:hypothetical protein
MEQEPTSAQMPPKNKHLAKVITFITFAIAIITASLFAGYFWATQTTVPDSEASETSQLLFVINGDATVAGDKLTMADDVIEWFTDRPNREAGQMSPDAFITAWQSGKLNDTPPNAAFSNLSAVVELTNPTIDSGTITFTVKTISGQLQDGTLPGTSLFIDAFPTSVNDQMTDIITDQ